MGFDFKSKRPHGACRCPARAWPCRHMSVIMSHGRLDGRGRLCVCLRAYIIVQSRRVKKSNSCSNLRHDCMRATIPGVRAPAWASRVVETVGRAPSAMARAARLIRFESRLDGLQASPNIRLAAQLGLQLLLDRGHGVVVVVVVVVVTK